LATPVNGLQLTSTPFIADREGVPPERPRPLHDEGTGAAGHQGGHAQDHGHHLQERQAGGNSLLFVILDDWKTVCERERDLKKKS
jgi:hypothetical protein